MRNEFWMRNKADVVNRPIEAPEIEEATPLNGAILANIGVGLQNNQQESVHVRNRARNPGRE